MTTAVSTKVEFPSELSIGAPAIHTSSCNCADCGFASSSSSSSHSTKSSVSTTAGAGADGSSNSRRINANSSPSQRAVATATVSTTTTTTAGAAAVATAGASSPASPAGSVDSLLDDNSGNGSCMGELAQGGPGGLPTLVSPAVSSGEETKDWVMPPSPTRTRTIRSFNLEPPSSPSNHPSSPANDSTSPSSRGKKTW